MSLDHIRVACLDQIRQALDGASFRFLRLFWIDNNQLFPARVIGERDAHDVICIAF